MNPDDVKLLDYVNWKGNLYRITERESSENKLVRVKLSRIGDKSPVPIGWWVRRESIERRWVKIFGGWRVNGIEGVEW